MLIVATFGDDVCFRQAPIGLRGAIAKTVFSFCPNHFVNCPFHAQPFRIKLTRLRE